MPIERILTGFSQIDELTGGIPAGSVISYWTNHSGARIDSLANYISNYQGKILFITSQYRPIELRRLSKVYESNKIVFLDGITWRYKRVNRNEKFEISKYHIDNLSDLNNLFAKITQACREINEISTILFDTPSSILMYTTPGKEQVYRFFELLTAFTRSRNITMIYTIDREIHDQNILSTLKFLSDGTIEFKQNGVTKECKIHDLIHFPEQTNWFELT